METRRTYVIALGLAGSLYACSNERQELAAGTSSDDSLTATSAAPISGPSPFAPDGCGHDDTEFFPYDFGVESDLTLSVNPRDARHLVAGWIQDNAVGVVVAVTRDAGETWAQVVVPGFSLCAGGVEARYYHTRLSFGADGKLYLAVQANNGFYPDPRNVSDARVPVAASADGGVNWGSVSYVDVSTDPIPQFDSLAAEPDVAGAAVIAWHDNEPTTTLVGATYLSRTTDGGASWTRLLVNRGEQDSIPWNRVVALPDGTLLVVALDATARGASGTPESAPVLVQVRRSSDKGLSWSAPATISENAEATWASAAVGLDGVVFIGWPGLKEDGSRWFFVASSADSGATWGVPMPVAQPTGPLPGLAVAGDGTVGFNYTDGRNSTAENPDTRDVWFAYSRDRGQSWHEIHLAGPFDLAADSSFFHETAGLPDGFGTVFLQGAPKALDGGTDVFFSRITVK